MYKPVRYDIHWLVICELCEKSYNKLWVHIRNTHEILTSEYRKMFGLDKKARLMSEESIELARSKNKENFKKVVLENLVKKWAETRFKDWHKWRTRDKVSEQTMDRLNKLYFYRKNING